MAASDRLTVIADAAIRLLAEDGARGLTHRAVDEAARLPAGSTSYYCRKRIDLLALAVKRFTELEHRRLVDYAKALSGPMSVQKIANVVAAQMLRWVRTQNRPMLTARLELFLTASREPELRAIVEKQRDSFEETMRRALVLAGAPDPAVAARALIALMEGMLLDALRTGSAVLNATELKATVRAILDRRLT
jgi:DNA-binding transcriptional regulator YbjK